MAAGAQALPERARPQGPGRDELENPVGDRTTGQGESRGGAPAPVVHVVDDEPSILQLFRQIAHMGNFEVRTYSTGRGFLEKADVMAPGCLVLDLNLPDMSGIEVLEELARRQSPMPAIFMSGRARVSQAVLAIKLGSLDFMEKPFPVKGMLEAIQRALEFDRDQREKAQQRLEMRARLDQLTPREAEVMGLVVQGHPNKVIAAELGVSPKTVEVHRANVMRKTGAQSVAELVRIVMTAREP